MLRLSAAIAFLSLAGCGLYMSDDQPPPVCRSPVQDHRNPYTGQCEPWSGGGGGCDNYCGPCPANAEDATPDIAQQEWPTCYGSCAGLDEQSCSSTPGCHTTYNSNSRADQLPTFLECWDIAPLPVTEGSCDGLDAYSCAMHDDCAGYFETEYNPDDSTKSVFAFCGAEQTNNNSCSTVDCGVGAHCEEQCYAACDGGPVAGGDPSCTSYCTPMCVPDYQNSCETVDCGPGYTCVEQCDGMTPKPNPNDPTTGTGSGGVPGYCYATCVQVTNEPGECYGDVWCDALPPACPANTTPGVLNGCYSGYCIPVAQCGPQDPGTCDAATCAVAPPACPSDTTAGVKNGCYTGYCIPNSSCPTLPCEALTTEQACLDRMECTAVYQGDNCTCDANGVCTCTSQAFSRCETWWL